MADDEHCGRTRNRNCQMQTIRAAAAESTVTFTARKVPFSGARGEPRAQTRWPRPPNRRGPSGKESRRPFRSGTSQRHCNSEGDLREPPEKTARLGAEMARRSPIDTNRSTCSLIFQGDRENCRREHRRGRQREREIEHCPRRWKKTHWTNTEKKLRFVKKKKEKFKTDTEGAVRKVRQMKLWLPRALRYCEGWISHRSTIQTLER